MALQIDFCRIPSTKWTQGVSTKIDFSHKQFSIRRYYMLAQIFHERKGSNPLFSEQGAKRFITENHLLVLRVLQILRNELFDLHVRSL